jgi:hypothetical protein
MNFGIGMTAGGEVIFAGTSTHNLRVDYGVPPETGLWKISKY